MHIHDQKFNTYTYNNDIYKFSLSSLINTYDIYNNLYRNSLSGYVNVFVTNLNNRVSSFKNLLTADFNLLETTTFSSLELIKNTKN